MTNKNKVLILGAEGFTGGYLVSAVQSSDRWTPISGRAVGVDLLDIRTFESALESVRPSAIINLAAISDPRSQDIVRMYDVNGLSVVRMLEALEQSSFTGKFITASSALVYGQPSVEVIDENQPTQPRHHYGLSKVISELACEQYMDRLDIIVTRPFNCIGHAQSPDYIVPKIISHFAEKRPAIQLGNIDVERDFVDIRDVANMYLAILNDGKPGQILNLCSGKSTSIRTIIAKLKDISGHSIDLQTNTNLVRKDDAAIICGDNRKLLSLPFEYQFTLDNTLNWMFTEAQRNVDN